MLIMNVFGGGIVGALAFGFLAGEIGLDWNETLVRNGDLSTRVRSEGKLAQSVANHPRSSPDPVFMARECSDPPLLDGVSVPDASCLLRSISATYQPQKRDRPKEEQGAVISQLLGLEIQLVQGGRGGRAEVEVIEATRRATTKEVMRAISNLKCFSDELEG
ncbi:hypothetical protein BGX38DRAFT_1275845 [Terfezia claveryi]|nr:hypothetical protein BGX38DRAFT_1275845 [Terfezia claveryi]